MALKALVTGDVASGIDFSEIQGDVLVGLQKKAEAFIRFDISDVAAFKRLLREEITPSVVWTAEVIEREGEIADAKKADLKAELPLYALNVLFSKSGLGKLVEIGGTHFGPAFDRAPEARLRHLKDDPTPVRADFKKDADGILLLAGPDEAQVKAMAEDWAGKLSTSASHIQVELGRVRPGDRHRGHEHFDFLDGVSQPGVKGLTEAAQPHGAGDEDQGLPGQDLIAPGYFVLGYDREPGKPAKPPLPWMKNGSYMVLRRLEQRVLEFHSFVSAAAASQKISEGLLGARLVGRWKSGAPVMVATSEDDPTLAADPLRNNDFDFNQDRNQSVCPFVGHIRKSYPRDDLDFTSKFPNKNDGEEFAEKHRIIRQGIPFGFEVDHDPTFPGPERVGHEASRGLMFVSYQSSIEDGFEFIQTKFCNETNFIPERSAHPGGPAIQPGHDLIIGQSGTAERQANLSNPDGALLMDHIPQFVIPTGTMYFFAPSRSALEGELSA